MHTVIAASHRAATRPAASTHRVLYAARSPSAPRIAYYPYPNPYAHAPAYYAYYPQYRYYYYYGAY